MISVDSVYQTVQRILNVEQRGQLPPADFNRFAKLAQDELFNNLFYDRAHFKINPKGNMEIRKENQEKIDVFIRHGQLNPTADGANTYAMPEDLYMLGTVYYDQSNGVRVIVDNIRHMDAQYIMNSPLTAPTTQLPKYVRFNSDAKGQGSITVYPNTITGAIDNADPMNPVYTTSLSADYVKIPTPPEWAYLMLGDAETPIYNMTDSTDFELHPSMEDDLVMKVLYYAAISTRQDDVASYAAGGIQQDEQSDKS